MWLYLMMAAAQKEQVDQICQQATLRKPCHFNYKRLIAITLFLQALMYPTKTRRPQRKGRKTFVNLAA